VPPGSPVHARGGPPLRSRGGWAPRGGGRCGGREDEEPRFVFGGVVRADRVFTTFTVLMLFKHIMGRFKELVEERADVEWTDEEEILAADPDLTTRAEMEALREVLGVEVDEDVLRYRRGSPGRVRGPGWPRAIGGSEGRAVRFPAGAVRLSLRSS